MFKFNKAEFIIIAYTVDKTLSVETKNSIFRPILDQSVMLLVRRPVVSFFGTQPLPMFSRI